MRPLKYAWILFSGAAFLLTSCAKYTDPLKEEQYVKSVYLVGANQSNNQGLEIDSLSYASSDTAYVNTYISAATGGSLNIDRDIKVNIANAGSYMVDEYNSLYLYKETDIKYRLLADSLYSIPDSSVTIKAGDVYANMPIRIKTAGLQCDSLYALSFRVASVSDPGYIAIRGEDSILMFSFTLHNAYSGNYQEAGSYYQYNVDGATPTNLSLSRTFKAVSYNQIRFFHLTSTEITDSIPGNGVVITINKDNSLSVSPWNSLQITDGGGTYDPLAKAFDIWYNYNSNGKVYQFKGLFTKS